MSEELNLQYCTEMVVQEDFLRRVLWRSLSKSWRKTYYIVVGIVYAGAIGVLGWLAVMTGDYSQLVLPCVVSVLVAAVVGFSVRSSINTSVRRWKEQNHEASVSLYSGFTEDGLSFGKAENRSLLYFTDMQKVFDLDGVWIFRTKANQLIIYNASQLSENDRESVLALLKSRNPKIKIDLPRKK